jgi:hypothetical protein
MPLTFVTESPGCPRAFQGYVGCRTRRTRRHCVEDPEAGTTGTAARGGTAVSAEVVEKIAAAAAREVPGVVELGGDIPRFFNTVWTASGLTRLGTRGAAPQQR